MSYFSYVKPSVKKQKGFTLIEVLVAAFIMFLVIASATMIYRSAMLSSSKAERTLVFSSNAEAISELVRIQIQSSKNQDALNAEGRMGKINYNWSAIITHQAKAPEQFNIDTGELDSGPNLYKLWHVTLTLTIGKASREYQFSEISW